MRDLVVLWNDGEFDAYLDTVGPEFEFTPDPRFPDSDTFRGEALRQWLREWVETWKRNELEVLEMDDRGQAVLARCRWHLQAVEGSAEVPAADFTLLLFFDDDDRPQRLFAFFDHERAEAALSDRGS
jgi:hypothetical protein